MRLEDLPLGVVRSEDVHTTELVQHINTGVVYAVCRDCRMVFDTRVPILIPCLDMQAIRRSPLMALFKN